MTTACGRAGTIAIVVFDDSGRILGLARPCGADALDEPCTHPTLAPIVFPRTVLGAIDEQPRCQEKPDGIIVYADGRYLWILQRHAQEQFPWAVLAIFDRTLLTAEQARQTLSDLGVDITSDEEVREALAATPTGKVAAACKRREQLKRPR